MDKYVCIHAHFYQPPRENPWLEAIEVQDSAYPYHDWNERIAAECYAPNTAARILGPDLKIIDIVNNYSKISYNFGPTVLSWLERAKPETYRGIIEADKESMKFFSGHGSAIAQVYNHMIMPLANKRDKYTQVIWGIADFKKRFGRDPEGMWLPETAVDTESLEILAEMGIKFTVLAPRQAKRVKRIGKDSWENLDDHRQVDPSMPYRCSLPSGRNISLFFYNGDIAHEVSFGGLLNSGEAFAKKLDSAFPPADGRPSIIHIATDGESYGHHHFHGEMALAYCIYSIEQQKLAKLTNYSEFLEKHPPEYMAEAYDNSSWSCVHGVERWRSDCGCNSGGHNGWNQSWRAPLKEAMDWLRDTLVLIFEHEASKYLKDPWEARNAYINVILDRSKDNVKGFLARHRKRDLSQTEEVMALKLLGMQRNAMLMYTSCGWFFDEISGIETVQVMNYASRAIQLANETTGLLLESEFLNMLEKAKSNIPQFENGRKVYENFVKATQLDLLRVGAHYSVSSLFQEGIQKSSTIYCYLAENDKYEKFESGKLSLALGKTNIKSIITWEEEDLCFGVLHMGDHNINAGVHVSPLNDHYGSLRKEILPVFERGNIPEIIRVMDKHFGTSYSLWHIFKDEQRKIINQILMLTYENIEASYRQIYENNYALMDFFHWLNIQLPKPLLTAAEYIINLDLQNALKDDIDLDILEALIRKAENLSVKIDSDTIGFVASSWINSYMELIKRGPENIAVLEKTRNVLKTLSPIPLKMNLWHAQNIYFSIGKAMYGVKNEMAKKGDPAAARWIAAFNDLGNYFHVKVS